MVPMPLQEDTGIEIYHPPGKRITLRRNVCKGYTYCGIFIKCKALNGTSLMQATGGNTSVLNRKSNPPHSCAAQSSKISYPASAIWVRNGR